MDSVLLFTEYKNKILSLLYSDNRLKKVSVHPVKKGDLGAVFIGKIKNIVPAIDACFVEYKKDCIGFLPLKQAIYAKVLNRCSKGSLAAGDEIIVQMETEGIKSKAPGLTCNLSLTGNYSVITCGNNKIGFSSKLKEDTKIRLKDWLYQSPSMKQIEEQRLGVVVRTNAAKLEDRQVFEEELHRLLTESNRILTEGIHRTTFSCIYQPPSSYITEIQNLYQWEYDRILTDIPLIYNELSSHTEIKKEIRFYDDKRISLSKLYNVSARMKEVLEERVWLKSGAYLIIQPTEALTVIDVNSGKIQKKHPGDDIYFTINKEAAKEIAFQLKLRNISGIIVIDFINQNKEEQDDELLRYFLIL
ncbi:MAG: ribonuclease E/G [Lachnospiraceae bacterium]|nr:ribonuclease E/G [Lachnospiraceae bacterium]